ncbi:MAG: UMP kinase [Oscillospiraceae bacterium]|nr:UMP kinase [Oscillospiraceae bacterium]
MVQYKKYCVLNGGEEAVNDTAIYRRVLLKLSGEALAGEKRSGLDFPLMKEVCAAVKRCADMGVEIGLVVGGGNFWRGAKDGGGKMERSRADHMGMLATVMNALALCDVFEQVGARACVMTMVDMPRFAEPYSRREAERRLKAGEIVIFACGTGSPFFSTDTGAVLKAAEIGAEAILLAKNVDGVYSADPRLDPEAVRYERVGYDEVLARRLGVMDLTATSLAMDNALPVRVFALADPENIVRVVRGEALGTLVD